MKTNSIEASERNRSDSITHNSCRFHERCHDVYEWQWLASVQLYHHEQEFEKAYNKHCTAYYLKQEYGYL